MKKELNQEELRNLVYKDELTRVHNLRYFREQIPQYLVQAKEQGWDVAFLMLDIDHFKEVNDNYGHPAGDSALVHFTKLLTKKIQDQGLTIRYAGDEFVLLIPRIDKQTARKIAEDIQRKLANSPVSVNEDKLPLQCSIGISLFPQDGKNLKTLLEKADRALYVAKEQGKNRIVITPDTGKLLTPSKLNSILDAPYIVGRDKLIETLEKHLSPKSDPEFFPVLMGGEGTGKSRLLHHAQEAANKKLDYTLFAKGYPFWQSDMYGGAFSALGSLFEQQSSISDKVFSGLDPKYRRLLKPYISSWYLKDLESQDEAQESDGLTLFEALTQTFFILRELGSGAVLLDDIDQIDTPSLQLFSSQYGSGEEGSLYFVSTIRSSDLTVSEEKLLSLLEAMPELSTANKVEQMILEPLQIENIHQLAGHLFDGKTLPHESALVLQRNSAGSPIFIVEALSTLLLDGKIFAAQDKWDLSQVQPEDIPDNLTDMIKNRILRLDKETIEILKVASILGEKINVNQLAEMSKLKVHQVLNSMKIAQRALLLEESPNPDEYIFTHRSTRSVLYSQIKETERRRYHARAVDLEQKASTESPERIVGKLAYHFHNAGQLEKAVDMFSTLKNQMDSVHISKGTRRILQKRIHSVSLAKESPLEAEDMSTALMIGRTFRSSLQNMRLYPKENENVRNSIKQFMNHLVPFLAEKTEALALSVTQENVLFNGQPLPPYHEDIRLTQDLYITMNSYGLQGILFLHGVTQDEVINFLEIFKRLPEETIGHWDSLLDQLRISHIFPDRKVFVAVGERKVFLDEHKLYARTEELDDEGAPTPPGAPGQTEKVDDQQMGQMRELLDQFAREKQELIVAIKSSDIRERDIQGLMNLLSQPKLGDLSSAVRIPEAVIPPKPTFSGEAGSGRYADIKPDRELVEEIANDLTLAFDDLSSPDAEIQAKAASWLAIQDPIKLADVGFSVITSDIPLKYRRLAAGVIKKAGTTATEEFFRKINVGMHIVPLIKALRVCDIFSDNPELVRVLRDISLKGAPEVIPPIVNSLKQIPGKKADALLLEIFTKSSGRGKWEIIPLFAKREMKQAIPILAEYIRPVKKWEKEENISLQEDICRTLGVFRSLDAADALIAAVNPPGFGSPNRAKPDTIRATAAWALTQLPKNPEVDRIVEKLKRDKSDYVRKAAELSEIFRE